MKRRRISAAAAVAVLAAAVATAGAGADLVKVGPLVLRANGVFKPNRLPAHKFAPIFITGRANITSVDGNPPPALTHLVLDLDRNGRLDTKGLPTCDPAKLANTTPVQARNRCKRSVVATGHVSARVSPPGQRSFGANSPLTAFNGPRVGGNPTVLLHAYMPFPAPAVTYVVQATLTRVKKGPAGYNMAADIPPIAGGYGAITHGDAKIGRKWTYKGKKHSYLNARCATGILFAHGRFTFANGTIIDGTIERPCNKLPTRKQRKHRRHNRR